MSQVNYKLSEIAIQLPVVQASEKTPAKPVKKLFDLGDRSLVLEDICAIAPNRYPHGVNVRYYGEASTEFLCDNEKQAEVLAAQIAQARLNLFSGLPANAKFNPKPRLDGLPADADAETAIRWSAMRKGFFQSKDLSVPLASLQEAVIRKHDKPLGSMTRTEREYYIHLGYIGQRVLLLPYPSQKQARAVLEQILDARAAWLILENAKAEVKIIKPLRYFGGVWIDLDAIMSVELQATSGAEKLGWLKFGNNGGAEDRHQNTSDIDGYRSSQRRSQGACRAVSQR